MEAEAEITMNIEIYCDECGTELTKQASCPQTKLNEFEIRVAPCQKCLDKAKDAGREDGYSDGYDNGFNNAKNPIL